MDENVPKVLKLKPLSPSGVMELAYLEVIVMPSGEVICNGKVVGNTRTLLEFLRKVGV